PILRLGEEGEDLVDQSVAFACKRVCALRAHRRAARAGARSTARLTLSPRSGSRGANLLPPFGRETIRAASNRDRAAEIRYAGAICGLDRGGRRRTAADHLFAYRLALLELLDRALEGFLVLRVRRLRERELRLGHRLLLVAHRRVGPHQADVDRPLVGEALRVELVELDRLLLLALALERAGGLVELGRGRR